LLGRRSQTNAVLFCASARLLACPAALLPCCPPLGRQGSVIKGTRLADYGGALDGFSSTYMHVLPGMQGNNIWTVRQLANLRRLQGNQAEAARLHAEARTMAEETVATMFATSQDKERGWFNVIYAAGPNGTKPLVAHEMRHVVDLFSLVFGLCGVKGTACDLTPTQRAQLSTFFHQELKTSDWIRATSPACNCSNSYTVPDPADANATKATTANANATGVGAGAGGDDGPWPALVTCKADREDHGSTGAYTAWPALAAEALCYLDGNCTAAFGVMASYAPNTARGRTVP